jgi:hypothetical protein
MRYPGFIARVSKSLVLVAAVCTIAGCGSGGTGGTGGGGGGGGGNQPEFTLSLSTPNLSMVGGQMASVTVSVTGSNGFASPVTLQILGLPSGVSFSPTNPQVSPGTPQQITFTAATTITAETADLTVSGTSGLITSTAGLDLTLAAAPMNPTTFRTRYTRTDASTEYFDVLNENWALYDPVTNRFFVADTAGNRIQVLDASKEALIATIPVPLAFTIDETPDHSVLYAGNELGDIYAVNPATMQVTQRYPGAQIGPSGFYSTHVHALANGDLALFGNTDGVVQDGYGSIAVWNPGNNSFTDYTGFCGNSLGIVTVTGDRSLIVAGAGPEGSAFGLCTLNPVTGQQNGVSGDGYGLYQIVPTPDGKSLLLPVFSPSGPTPNGQIAVVNAQTLQQTSVITVVGTVSTMTVSPDSQTVYVGNGAGILSAYNIASGTETGWMPNLTVESTTGQYGGYPLLEAFDGTGLLAGPVEEGVAFLDTSTLKPLPVGSAFLNDYLDPATGPASGGTSVAFEDLNTAAKMTSAYLGGFPMSAPATGGSEFNAITPAGNPGPADLYAQMADGGMLIVPEAYSYGPTILEVTPDAATAEGGGTGIVYGYGFGPVIYNAPIPSDLQITVGSHPATVTGYADNAYETSGQPFPLQAAAYTIPPGTAGSSAALTVSTSSGTATTPSALQYLPAIQQFNLAGAVLAQGIYDPTRSVYYFTDGSEIRVFSRTLGTWLSAIQVPAAPSGVAHRLLGIAISADGTKLAVADAGTAKIYLIDPASTNSVQTFPVLTYVSGSPDALQGVITYPIGLAISNSGNIYYAAYNEGTSGTDGFFKLNTNTGAVTDYDIDSFGGDLYRVAITSDNSKVFFNNDGQVFSVDPATDRVTEAIDDPDCCYGDYELTLAPGQTTMSATGYFYDTNLNAESYFALNDREALDISYVYGAKFSPDGSLFFQPSTNGIDVFDGRLGTLRARISLPVALSQNYDALVSDGTDDVLVAITGQTGNGIAVVDLSSLPEPPPLTYPGAQVHLNSLSFESSESATNQPRVKRNTTVSAGSAGKYAPKAPVKHIVNGALLNRSGTPARSGPANP